MSLSTTTSDKLLIVVFSLLSFFPLLGNVHLFDWDEINFAECAREMIVSGDYLHVQIDYLPFHEKPPLFVWMQALSMKLFGINEYAARFPNAVCGLTTLLLLYYLGKRLHNQRIARWWVLAYAGSILPHFYFKSGIMDPWFNLFILLAYYLIYIFAYTNKYRYILLSGLSCGLAILVKGPVALLIIALCLFFLQLVYLFTRSQKNQFFYLSPGSLFLFCIISLFPISLWYGIDIIKNGPTLFNEFIAYQIRLFSTEDAGHGGFWGYHVVVLLLGCFPASFLALHYIQKKYWVNFYPLPFNTFMGILFFVVLILFSIVKSKIVHYSSLCYFPISYFTALYISRIQQQKSLLSNMSKYALLAFSLLISLLIVVAPMLLKNKILLQSLLKKDPFAVENLNASTSWHGFESIVGVLFFITLVYIFIKCHRKPIQWLQYTFITTAGLLQFVFLFYIQNIEAISQRASINFYKSLEHQDVYVATYAYKSYAPYFYKKTTHSNNKNSQGQYQNPFIDPIDKPLYFSAKIQHKEELFRTKSYEFLYEKNGFVFFRRIATDSK